MPAKCYDPPGAPSLRYIAAAASMVFEVPLSGIVGPRRTVAMCAPRHALFAIARSYGYSLVRCGAVVDRDHTCVVNGVARARKWTGDLRDMLERTRAVIEAGAPIVPHGGNGIAIARDAEPVKVVKKAKIEPVPDYVKRLLVCKYDWRGRPKWELVTRL